MNENLKMNHSLIITIVKKGLAKKLCQAAIEAGAEGETTILARQATSKKLKKFIGLSINEEKEVILTVVKEKDENKIFDTIIEECRHCGLKDTIVLIIDIKKVDGIVHLFKEGSKEMFNKSYEMELNNKYDLIVTIVERGRAQLVGEAVKKNGGYETVIIGARGAGIHEKAKLFGFTIEPEKEIILSLVLKKKTEQVLNNIIEKAELHKSGKGLSFVLDVKKVANLKDGIEKPRNKDE
ncbi:P-II family nitrogen regulator [Natronospora cellulosivora (SeqCode)]